MLSKKNRFYGGFFALKMKGISFVIALCALTLFYCSDNIVSECKVCVDTPGEKTTFSENFFWVVEHAA